MSEPLYGPATEFEVAYNRLAEIVHADNVRKGWWLHGTNRNPYEMLALIHSEISECVEALRTNNGPSDHIPEFSGVEEELADTVIRVMDMGRGFGWDVAAAVSAKLQFNRGRPYRHGGKAV